MASGCAAARGYINVGNAASNHSPDTQLFSTASGAAECKEAAQQTILPKDSETFAQVVHTDGVAASVMFMRPKAAEPRNELPRMGKQEGAVNPLAHLGADWLGYYPENTNMVTVGHKELYPSGAVKSVWHRSLISAQYYRQITQHAKESEAWMAGRTR
ncbi:hypothetical protein V8C86DRAFT_2430528 [Haematococcus lacustris]